MYIKKLHHDYNVNKGVSKFHCPLKELLPLATNDHAMGNLADNMRNSKVTFNIHELIVCQAANMSFFTFNMHPINDWLSC